MPLISRMHLLDGVRRCSSLHIAVDVLRGHRVIKA
jgi:hypothetical protein